LGVEKVADKRDLWDRLVKKEVADWVQQRRKEEGKSEKGLSLEKVEEGGGILTENERRSFIKKAGAI